jgi:outer membrane protein with beta-barrel domain
MKLTYSKSPWLIAMAAILICLLCVPATSLEAQPEGYTGIEIAPMVGYMFGGKLRGYNGELDISDEFSYGIRVSKAFNYGTAIELSWSSMKSEAVVRSFYESNSEKFDMGVNYFMIGVTQAWEGSEEVQPYGLLGLGASIFSANGNESLASGDEWFFAAEFGLGVKVHISDFIGLRFQGRFLLPMIFGGANLWCGTGGCGSGIYTTSAILQGDLTGGLVFRF